MKGQYRFLRRKPDGEGIAGGGTGDIRLTRRAEEKFSAIDQQGARSQRAS